MSDFFIDTQGNDVSDGIDDECDVDETNERESTVQSEECAFLDELPDEYKGEKVKKKKEDTYNFNDTYLITSYKENRMRGEFFPDVNTVVKKSEIQPGLEKQHAIPVGRRASKLERKKLREKTKGKKWFDMPAPEMTEEIKTDLQVLKMRAVLDKNHVYKKNSITGTPKYFQIGTVVEGAADFYSGRIVKSQRKKTLVDELLADAQCKNYQKKKFKEVMNVHRRKKHSKPMKSKGKKKK